MRGILLVFAALALAAVLVLVANTPPTPESWYPKCTFYQSTGLHCPGCGTGRALHSALNGHFLQAAHFNLYSLLILPAIAVVIARSAIRWAIGSPAQHRHLLLGARWIWLLFTAIMLFWILRNIHIHPFTLLAPHELSP